MPDDNWIPYVGIITGVVGAATGIAGAVMGYISLRRSTKLKSLDLRLELRKSISNLSGSIVFIKNFITTAYSLKKDVAAAAGRLSSSNMDYWQKQVDEDRILIEHLLEKFPDTTETLSELNTEELEAKLVEVHSLQNQINYIREKYESSFHMDDDERKRLEDSQRNS